MSHFITLLMVLGGAPFAADKSGPVSQTNRITRGIAMLIGVTVGSFGISRYFEVGMIVPFVGYFLFDLVLLQSWNGPKWTKSSIVKLIFRFMLSLSMSVFVTQALVILIYKDDLTREANLRVETELRPFRDAISRETARLTQLRQSARESAEQELRVLDSSIADASANSPCEGITKRKACAAATDAAAQQVKALQDQREQLVQKVADAASAVSALPAEILSANAGKQAQIDEVLARNTGGFASDSELLGVVQDRHPVQFWGIYLICFSLEFLAFILKLTQSIDEIDIIVSRAEQTLEVQMSSSQPDSDLPPPPPSEGDGTN